MPSQNANWFSYILLLSPFQGICSASVSVLSEERSPLFPTAVSDANIHAVVYDVGCYHIYILTYYLQWSGVLKLYSLWCPVEYGVQLV